jgi:phosphoglycerate kinase
LFTESLEKAKQKNVTIEPRERTSCGEFKFAADAQVKTFTKAEGDPGGMAWARCRAGIRGGLCGGNCKGPIRSFGTDLLGVYEFEAFQGGTRGILEACAAAKERGALVVIGGGDCGACATQLGIH